MWRTDEKTESFEKTTFWFKTVSVARNNAANKYLAMHSFTRNFEKKPLLFKTQRHRWSDSEPTSLCSYSLMLSGEATHINFIVFSFNLSVDRTYHLLHSRRATTFWFKTVSVARNNAANKNLAMYSFTRNFEKKPFLFKTQLHMWCRPTRLANCCIVLGHWNNSPPLNMSLNSTTLFWFRAN
jgi:hypothetical protein